MPDSPEESSGDYERTLKIYTSVVLGEDLESIESRIGPLSEREKQLRETLIAEVAQTKKDHPDWVQWIPWDG